MGDDEDKPAGRDGERLGRFRVEHRTREGTELLAAEVRCFPHHTELALFAAQLRLAGRALGELALVDAATGAVAARLSVARGARRGAAGGAA